MMIRCDAFAKVNLYLHICGKRADGYHELDSLVVFAETGDRIEVTAASDLSLSLTGPLAGLLKNETDNLVLQAARKLQELCGVKEGAHIVLEKHLPVAAGIGGGSGDAAATIKALCQLWDVAPSMSGLEQMALFLGADVPICLTGRAAHMGGIGEIINLRKIPECWMVLVNPGVAVSTPSVFKARRGDFKPLLPISDQLEFNSFIKALKERSNDLMDPAINIEPIIETVLNILMMQNGCALSRMSGSGATCFALFEEKSDAENAKKAIKTAHLDWWVEAAKLVC